MKKKLHKLLIAMAITFVSLTGITVQAEALEYVDYKADVLKDEQED